MYIRKENYEIVTSWITENTWKLAFLWRTFLQIREAVIILLFVYLRQLSNTIDFEPLNTNILLLLSTKCYHIPFVHFSSAFSNCPVYHYDFEARNPSHWLVREAGSLQRGSFSVTSYNSFTNDLRELQYTLRKKHESLCLEGWQALRRKQNWRDSWKCWAHKQVFPLCRRRAGVLQ